MRRLSLAALMFLATTIASAAVDPMDSMTNLGVGITTPALLVSHLQMQPHPAPIHRSRCPQHVPVS